MAAIEFMVIQADVDSIDGTTQDFTHGSETWTPKAAIFLYNRATANDGGEDADEVLAYGFTDGTSQCAGGSRIDDASTSNSGDGSDSKCFIDPENDNWGGEFSAFISGGIRCTIRNGASITGRVTILLFGGDDFEAHLEVFNTANQLDADPKTVTCGFQPDVVFAGSHHQLDGFGNQNLSLGLSDGTNNYSLNSYNTNEVEVRSYLSDGDCQVYITTSKQAAVAVDNFTSTTYDVNTTDPTPTASWVRGFLAMRFGGDSVKLELVDSPNSTGDWVHTGVGYTPLFAILLASTHDVVNTLESDGTGLGYCFGAFNASEMACVGARHEDKGTGNSVAKSWQAAEALILRDDNGTLMYGAGSAAVSMDSDGFTISDLTTANATTHKFIVFTVAGTAVATGRLLKSGIASSPASAPAAFSPDNRLKCN